MWAPNIVLFGLALYGPPGGKTDAKTVKTQVCRAASY